MKVKALNGFSGIISMHKGEIRNIDNEKVIKDLISAGLIEEITSKGKKVVTENEIKSNNT